MSKIREHININTDLTQVVGDRSYELSNHLGNVLQVVTDRKLAIENGEYDLETYTYTSATPDGIIDYFTSDVVSQSDYYPFGMLLPGRNSSDDSYRYGFNGMEMDDEVSGEGNSYDFGARMYNARVGRFLSLDPMQGHFPWQSPYIFANNNPIALVDFNGEAGGDPRWGWYQREGLSVIAATEKIQITETYLVKAYVGENQTRTATRTTTNNANKFKGLYVIAQRRMENGFKETVAGNNPMNVKSKGDLGFVELKTNEFYNGVETAVTDKFGNFSSMEAGYQGYFDLLESNFNDAYMSLTDDGKTIKDFASGLMNGRLGVYATNPKYPEEMKSMLKGVVADFETMYETAIATNNAKIVNIQEQLAKMPVIGPRRVPYGNRDILEEQLKVLKKENKQHEADLKELEEFKKNEGL